MNIFIKYLLIFASLFLNSCIIFAADPAGAGLLPDESKEQPLNNPNYLLLVIDVEVAYYGMGSDKDGPLDPVVLRVLYEVEKAKGDGARILFLEYVDFTVPHLINAVLDYPKATFLPKKKSLSGAKELDEFIRQNNINRDIVIKVAGVELPHCVLATCFDLKEMGYNVLLLQGATDLQPKAGKTLNGTIKFFEENGIKVQKDPTPTVQFVEEIDPRTYEYIARNLDDPDFEVRTHAAFAFGEFQPREKIRPFFEKAVKFLTLFGRSFAPPLNERAGYILDRL